jgi:hypothetical protein
LANGSLSVSALMALRWLSCRYDGQSAALGQASAVAKLVNKTVARIVIFS